MKEKIAVIGLGYVGLPLAICLAKKFNVLGFDINESRIKALKKNKDFTNEISSVVLKSSKKITYTNQKEDLIDCSVFIITVPTPIDKFKRPDLEPIKTASEFVGSILKKDDLVIYESTVYPGLTEEFCIPLLEQNSNLKLNKDFYCGYSPERINPGDKKRSIESIVKVVSASCPIALKRVDKIYSSVINAGTHLAESIKVAEAAKVIENTQRDVNIALINELSILFDNLGINTFEVLEAAKSKWNFLDFSPGLVGGHCIGVDPYYLTHKAHEVGHNPELILAGRRINDQMAKDLSDRFLKALHEKKIESFNSKILLMGYTFKENCPDTRNTKVFDLVKYLNKFTNNIEIYDPWADMAKVPDSISNLFIKKPKNKYYDGIFIAVAHQKFKNIGKNKIINFAKKKNIIFDIKDIFKDRENFLTL